MRAAAAAAAVMAVMAAEDGATAAGLGVSAVWAALDPGAEERVLGVAVAAVAVTAAVAIAAAAAAAGVATCVTCTLSESIWYHASMAMGTALMTKLVAWAVAASKESCFLYLAHDAPRAPCAAHSSHDEKAPYPRPGTCSE